MSDETKPDLPVTTEEAPNTTLDAVTDLALDSTIPAPIRRNVFKAFDRLCSALIDVPVEALERRSSEKRAESEARIKIIRENADQIAQQMKVDPEYARIAVSKYGQKILREQVNLDKISAIAAEELKKAIAAEKTNQSTGEPNKEGPAEATNQGTDNNEETTINDDWLNNFETEARQVSTEDMQRHFGRVLAGEIRKPGSYSTRTVKILSELDHDVAVLFKKLCSTSIAFENRTDGYVIDVRVLTLGRNLRQVGLSEGCLNYYQLDNLIEYGLVDFMENVYLYPYNLCIENLSNPMPQPFWHQERDWIFSPLDPIQEFKLQGFSCSRAGRELYRIVDIELMPEYTEDLKKFLAEQNLAMIEVNT
ncbi:hypothetical protein C6501_00535 [Candidatus Poribacteria bacterium]|nr:MAG: hypothetical protein C6501_00535 [Candidatus Poribacteria bacterium]